MSAIINLNLDLKKIPTSKVYKGAKGNYVSITVFVNDEVKTFQNGDNISNFNASAIVSQTKEEREAKAERSYIGNGAVAYVGDEGIKSIKDLISSGSSEVEVDEIPDLPF